MRQFAPSAEIWAGENGPIGGGDDGSCGTDAACGLYATTLWFADDMATRAKSGFVSYQRQDLFGGAYGMTSSVSGVMALSATDPVLIRPDYWMSFLYKRTLGTSVLNATSSSALLRAYAYTGAPPSPFAAAECVAAGTQLLLLNLANTTATDVTLPAAAAGATYAAWILAPSAAGPFSPLATLNGAALPTTIDVSKADPRAFLQHIVQPAQTGAVAAGIALPPLATAFICY